MKKIVVHYTIGFHYPLRGGVETVIRDFAKMTPEFEHVVFCKNGDNTVKGGLLTIPSVTRQTNERSSPVPKEMREKYKTEETSFEFDETTIERLKNINPHAIVIYNENARDMFIPLLEMKIPVMVIRSQGYNALTADMIRNSEASVICIDETQHRYFSDNMGNKILALGQVYDDRVFYKMNAPKIPGKRSFVYVGRMAEEKNVLDLVRVAKRLEKEGEDFILHMIGGGTPEPYADLVAKEIGVSRNIVFKNTWLPHENLRSVYNMFDYLVIPSKFESFCCSALEGLACGCGLITNTKTMEWANGKRINGTDLSEDFEEGLYLAMKKAIREPVAESFSKDVFEKFSYTKNRSRWREVLE